MCNLCTVRFVFIERSTVRGQSSKYIAHKKTVIFFLWWEVLLVTWRRYKRYMQLAQILLSSSELSSWIMLCTERNLEPYSPRGGARGVREQALQSLSTHFSARRQVSARALCGAAERVVQDVPRRSLVVAAERDRGAVLAAIPGKYSQRYQVSTRRDTG